MLSVKLRLLVTVRQIPFVLLFFLADWLQLISQCSRLSEVILKYCATLATLAAALQWVHREKMNPFMLPDHLHVQTGGQLLQLVSVPLESLTL